MNANFSVIDYVKSKLPLEQLDDNLFQYKNSKWKYDPDIEANLPEYDKQKWAEDVVKILRKNR